MKLARKTFVAIAFTLGLLIAIQFFFTRAIILKGFDKLEDMSARKNVERVKDATTEQISNLETKAVDWAMWDDAYKYVQDANKEFVESNLQDSALTGLKVNLLAFIQPQSGKIIFGKEADLETSNVQDISSSILEHFKQHPDLFKYQDTTQHNNGVIVLTSGGAMIVSSQPIIKSDGTGPIAGALVIGRYLNQSAIDNLSRLTHLKVEAKLAKELPPTYTDAKQNLATEKANYIKITSENEMTGYAMIKDIYGVPALYISVTIPRDVHAQAKATMLSFLLAMLTGALLLTLVMNFVVNRSVVNPIVVLNRKIQQIGQSGDLSLRVPVKGKDEIAELSTEMNKMLHAIHESKNSMKRLLDNTLQGFMAFDNKGVISAEFSKSVLTIFEQNPAGKHIANIFCQKESQWNDYVDAIFAETLPFSDLIGLCPKELTVKEKNIELLYKDIRNSDDKLTHVMVVATDVTELRKLQEQKEAESKLNNAIIKILQAKNDFAENVEMANTLDKYKNDLSEFKRKLHTLKGSFGFLGCHDFAEVCHKFEDQLKDDHSMEALDKACVDIKEVVNTFVDKYQHVLNISKNSGRTIDVPSNTLHRVLELAYQTNASEGVINELTNILERPINESFGWIENVFKATAERFGKEVLPVVWDDSSVAFDPDNYRSLCKSLIHIPRNSADHGIESPCDRECLGKPREGKLTIQLKLDKGMYYLTIKDDGHGVDFGKVKKKAKTLSLKEPQTMEETHELLFTDGFSIKEEITETSGRGVGLSAIREEARRLDGDAKIESVEGEGTTITVWFKKLINGKNIIPFTKKTIDNRKIA
ncbi:MAG: HAMP domain-containing protein [Oligoflexia bacterium]|nr:HAMP domain-containing protein [Oligoflexia bacterium]MBF0365670.1 HAMP domain-containing protein [Oligoflexia bacterium]